MAHHTARPFAAIDFYRHPETTYFERVRFEVRT